MLLNTKQGTPEEAPFLFGLFVMGSPSSVSWSPPNSWTYHILPAFLSQLSFSFSYILLLCVLLNFCPIPREVVCIFYSLLEFSLYFLPFRITWKYVFFKSPNPHYDQDQLNSQFLVHFVTPQAIPMCNFENQWFIGSLSVISSYFQKSFRLFDRFLEKLWPLINRDLLGKKSHNQKADSIYSVDYKSQQAFSTI